ncbi:MAG TPA: glycosyltransferase family 4 protein [Thermoanaerobaculia bacterium]|nr:glycosyltransferase family 4 protein [Thermoanaerobaculia bacterium]
MRILIYSPAFLPSIGGLEIGQALLADCLARRGHQVTVVTRTPPAAGAAGATGAASPAGATSATSAAGNAGAKAAAAAFQVLRRPRPLALLRAVRRCDVFFQANVSLRGLWPLLLVRRPWAVSHHSWYCRSDGHVAWQDRLKRYLLRFAAVSISVSAAMAADLDTPSLVIPNAYRDHLFRRLPEVEREVDLIFLGRLVSDKGVDLLIAALGQLAERGLRPHLTVVGDGPELPRLRGQAERLGVAAQVELLGTRRDGDLVPLLNRHRILVMPSRYNEPFGVAALEGIACGCVVVGSAGGGLPEAIGPCGIVFPNGSVTDLAAVLADLLRHPERQVALRAGAAEHLASHASERIAGLYHEALTAIDAASGGD